MTCQDTVLFLKASMVGRWDCKVVTETLIGTIFLNEEYPLFCVSFFLFELLSRYIKLNIQRGGLYTSIHVVYIYIYICVCVYMSSSASSYLRLCLSVLSSGHIDDSRRRLLQFSFLCILIGSSSSGHQYSIYSDVCYSMLQRH